MSATARSRSAMRYPTSVPCNGALFEHRVIDHGSTFGRKNDVNHAVARLNGKRVGVVVGPCGDIVAMRVGLAAVG
jgi:hypothetical protein